MPVTPPPETLAMSISAGLSPEDRFAIKDLLARYGWALDTGDTEAFVACFAPDGVMVEEVFEDPDVWRGRDGIRRLAEHYRSIPNFPGRQHYCDNTLLARQPGGAVHARSFAMVTECQGEPPYPLRFCGYYDDELVQLDGRWCFSRRTVRLWDGAVLERFPGRGAYVPRQRPPEFQLVNKS
ncbi:nuclear transport factor 2 family protein [Aquabacterium sp.]|uniref:nuclear transport factor 2 family protein n=1 Tax=Aquabacterium sp. TaxID=1872578 RepID=UPI002D7ED46B|nr:nuclear transport factor 2 family protein [Aquabacterium sp.]